MPELFLEKFLQLQCAAPFGFVMRIKRRIGLELLERLNDTAGIADRLAVEK